MLRTWNRCVGLNGVKPVLVRELSERRTTGGFGTGAGRSICVAMSCCTVEESADVGVVTSTLLSSDDCSFSGSG